MEQFKDFMGKFVDKTVETTKTIANKASETYHDPAVRQSAREIGYKVFDVTKEVGSKIVVGTKKINETVSTNVREKGFVNYSKELGALALDKTIDLGTQVYGFTVSTAAEVKQQTQEKGILPYTKEIAGKGVDKIKQGYDDTLGYLKNRKNINQIPNTTTENVAILKEDSLNVNFMEKDNKMAEHKEEAKKSENSENFPTNTSNF